MSAPARVTPSVSETTSKVPRGTLYRGNEGMWSWVLHRITGVAIFFFLLVHVLDTALIRVSPEAYNAVIGTYKNPIMGIGEVALVGARSPTTPTTGCASSWSTSGRGRPATSVSSGGACSASGSSRCSASRRAT